MEVEKVLLVRRKIDLATNLRAFMEKPFARRDGERKMRKVWQNLWGIKEADRPKQLRSSSTLIILNLVNFKEGSCS